MRSRSLKKQEENKTGVRTAGENDSRQVGNECLIQTQNLLPEITH